MIVLKKDGQEKIVDSEGLKHILIDCGWKSDEQEPQDDIEELKALCDERGIKYHHKAGVTKLKELLEG